MKEVSYNNILSKDIEKSKIKGDFLNNVGCFFLMGSLILVQILGVIKIFEFGGLTSIPFVCGFYGVAAALGGIKTYKDKKNEKAARESLANLENDLKSEGINLSIADLQKAIVTKEKREIKETNRKGEIVKVEEIINRYYMLDKEEQMQVIQQTLRECKSEGLTNYTMNSQLLEPEDMQNIELPEIVIKKSLRFNDTKK